MREIRFKAYDKKNKRWIGDKWLEYLCVGHDDTVVVVTYKSAPTGNYIPADVSLLTNNDTDNLEIVQNIPDIPEVQNKDLFDKDIVRWVDTEGTEFIKQITIAKNLTVFIGEISYFSLVNSGYFQTTLEKIGNSFENPELLEK